MSAGEFEERWLDRRRRDVQLDGSLARDDRFTGRETRDVVVQPRVIRASVRRHEEVAGRDVEVGCAERLTVENQRNQITALPLHDEAFGGRSRCEDADYLSLDDPLC